MWIVAREMGLKLSYEREVTRINESNSETEKERWNLRIAPVELFKFMWVLLTLVQYFKTRSS